MTPDVKKFNLELLEAKNFKSGNFCFIIDPTLNKQLMKRSETYDKKESIRDALVVAERLYRPIKHYDWPVRDGGQMYVYALAGWHQSVDKLAESLK
jgi:hypothetical protein